MSLKNGFCYTRKILEYTRLTCGQCRKHSGTTPMQIDETASAAGHVRSAASLPPSLAWLPDRSIVAGKSFDENGLKMACREGGRRGAREEGEEGNVGVGAKEMIETTRISEAGRDRSSLEGAKRGPLVPRVFVVLRAGCPRTLGPCRILINRL